MFKRFVPFLDSIYNHDVMARKERTEIPVLPNKIAVTDSVDDKK
ncbi:MAG: hypothetical protein WC139_01255 [Candidatus Kapaibacterium sp.]